MNNAGKKLKTLPVQVAKDVRAVQHQDSVKPESKPPYSNVGLGFSQRSGGSGSSWPNSTSVNKSLSIFDLGGKTNSPRFYKTVKDMNDFPNTGAVLRKCSIERSNVESDSEPKSRLNTLISIMVSTIMCLAAKCPLPRSNIQATKLFLGTIVNERGETPRNIGGLLDLLKSYDGPYDGESVSFPTPEPQPQPLLSKPEPQLEKAVTQKVRATVGSRSPVKSEQKNTPRTRDRFL